MEGGNISGHAMLHNVSIQATVVEALIFNYEHIFSEEAFIPKPDGELISYSTRLYWSYCKRKPRFT